ncbi:MAG TPA: general stress protein [Gemmataceae bacterium]|nr:general stress protein [Gemmataceae bacterium]
MSTEQSVVGIYTHIDSAEDAVKKLGEGGFPIDHVSIIAKDLGSEKKVHGFVTSCDVARASATTGAWVGGIFGLLVGAAFVWVPGVGPLIVAGSLTAALAGGLEGAVAGAAVSGVLGWLAALGISKQHILKYEESVKAGKYLVIAHGSADEVAKARQILQGTSPSELTLHAESA